MEGTTSTSAIAELTKTINGYEGYHTPKNRDKTDEKFREFLSSKLDSIAERLSRIEEQFQSSGKNHKEFLHQAIASLKTIIYSLKNPCYCNHAFFSQPVLSSEKIAQLYDYDFQIKEQIEILDEESSQLILDNNDTELNDMLNHLYDVIDGVNQSLTEREFVIMGNGG